MFAFNNTNKCRVEIKKLYIHFIHLYVMLLISGRKQKLKFILELKHEQIKLNKINNSKISENTRESLKL